MSSFLESYCALSVSSSRPDVATVLQSIIDGTPFPFSVPSVFPDAPAAFPSQIDVTSRKKLVQTVLDDLTRCGASNAKKSRLSSKGTCLLRHPAKSTVRSASMPTPMPVCADAFQALLAVKTLGKDPAGSEVIASPANLMALLGMVNAFKDNADASNEALRCLANALLLISGARDTFVRKDVGGGEAIIELFEVCLGVLMTDGYLNAGGYRKRPTQSAYSLHLVFCSCVQSQWRRLPATSRLLLRLSHRDTLEILSKSLV